MMTKRSQTGNHQRSNNTMGAFPGNFAVVGETKRNDAYTSTKYMTIENNQDQLSNSAGTWADTKQSFYPVRKAGKVVDLKLFIRNK